MGHYRMEQKIGEGGMGEVYRAVDTRLNREVAVKFSTCALMRISLPRIVSTMSQIARFG